MANRFKITIFIILIILLIIFVILLSEYDLSEPDPSFPSDTENEGLIINDPQAISTDEEIIISWSVNIECKYNEIQYQKVNPSNQNEWSGNVADCINSNGEYVCKSAIFKKSLLDNKYEAQIINNGCVNNINIISPVFEFKK